MAGNVPARVEVRLYGNIYISMCQSTADKIGKRKAPQVEVQVELSCRAGYESFSQRRWPQNSRISKSLLRQSSWLSSVRHSNSNKPVSLRLPSKRMASLSVDFSTDTLIRDPSAGNQA